MYINMKKLLYIFIIIISFVIGRVTSPSTLVVERCNLDHSKDYTIACVLSDICRIALDDPNLDRPGFEDLYWDVIDNLDIENISADDFSNYVYSY